MEIEKLKKAYRDCFGSLGNRSESQQLVIDDLSKRFLLEGAVFMPVDGTICPLRAAVKDGRRQVIISIKQMLEEQS